MIHFKVSRPQRWLAIAAAGPYINAREEVWVKMAIKHWSDEIIIVDLSREPEMFEELNGVAGILYDRDVRSVIIDFSDVDIVTSSSLSKLLELRNLMADWGRRLVFCSVAAAIEEVFTVTGLEKGFELVDDRFVALTIVEMAG